MEEQIETVFFIKFFDNHKLSEIMEKLYHERQLSKTDPLLTALPMELKYQLVRLASLGVVKFEKGQVLLNVRVGQIAA